MRGFSPVSKRPASWTPEKNQVKIWASNGNGLVFGRVGGVGGGGGAEPQKETTCEKIFVLVSPVFFLFRGLERLLSQEERLEFRFRRYTTYYAILGCPVHPANLYW